MIVIMSKPAVKTRKSPLHPDNMEIPINSQMPRGDEFGAKHVAPRTAYILVASYNTALVLEINLRGKEIGPNIAQPGWELARLRCKCGITGISRSY